MREALAEAEGRHLSARVLCSRRPSGQQLCSEHDGERRRCPTYRRACPAFAATYRNGLIRVCFIMTGQRFRIATGGRASLRQSKIYVAFRNPRARDGTLVASVAQEGLGRIRRKEG